MAFIKAALAEAAESEVVPEGEYHLKVVATEDRDTKKGDPMTVVTIAIESGEHPNAAPISLYFVQVKDDDEARTKNMKLVQMKRFLVAFEIPHEDDGYDTDDFLGAEADLLVTQRTVEPDDAGKAAGKKPFTVNEIQLPRLASEPKEEPKAAGKGASKKKR